LKVSIIGDVMTVSLCGMCWAGSEAAFDELVAAFITQREAARNHQTVMESMLPPRRKP
jgi:ketol-acid reductoisomerase